MADAKPIKATIHVSIKPWDAPNFAVRSEVGDGGIPVKDLDDDALEEAAYAWLVDLYRKAGRRTCPFYRPTQCRDPSQ